MLVKTSGEVTVTLPSETEIRFTRFFARPAQLLFHAWTQPEHVRRWYGCQDSTIVKCEIDLRVGGAWQIVMRMPDGNDHPFKGVYREIVPGEKLVYTESYDVEWLGRPRWLTIVNFDTVEGGTVLTHTVRHDSREARDGHLQSGMETGEAHMLQRLDAQVLRLASGAVGDQLTAPQE